jgi:hypothetical protein
VRTPLDPGISPILSAVRLRPTGRLNNGNEVIPPANNTANNTQEVKAPKELVKLRSVANAKWDGDV